MIATLNASAAPLIQCSSVSVGRNAKSLITAHGGLNVPTVFFPPERFIAFFTPTPTSFCASTVVGSRTRRKPRWKSDAANPTASSTAPPPIATTYEWRHSSRSKKKPMTSRTKPSSPLIASPPGTSRGASASSTSVACAAKYAWIRSDNPGWQDATPESTKTTARAQRPLDVGSMTPAKEVLPGSNTFRVKTTGYSNSTVRTCL